MRLPEDIIALRGLGTQRTRLHFRHHEEPGSRRSVLTFRLPRRVGSAPAPIGWASFPNFAIPQRVSPRFSRDSWRFYCLDLFRLPLSQVFSFTRFSGRRALRPPSI